MDDSTETPPLGGGETKPHAFQEPAFPSQVEILPAWLIFKILFLLTPKAFCIGVQPINNGVIISGEQQRDSSIHIHVSILPQTHLPSRLAHNIEQSFMCYTTELCLSILNRAVCT